MQETINASLFWSDKPDWSVPNVCLNSLDSSTSQDMTSHAMDLINCIIEILGVLAKVSPKCIIKVYRGH